MGILLLLKVRCSYTRVDPATVYLPLYVVDLPAKGNFTVWIFARPVARLSTSSEVPMPKHPLLAVIVALRQNGDRQTAAGLAACARLARVLAPTHGLLMPEGRDRSVERIARKYFGMKRA